MITFNRAVSKDLLDALRPDGKLRWLLEHRTANRVGIDFQLRADGGRSWMSMYLGLTSVLNLIAVGRTFRLTVHATHQKAGRFDTRWSQPQSGSRLNECRTDVEAYLDKILSPSAVASKHLSKEGRVQAAISRSTTKEFGTFQREAVPAFRDAKVRDILAEPFRQRILVALNPTAHKSQPWWPGIRDRGVLPKSGLETDLLGLDKRGRLLVMEVKPANEVKGITWAPGQVRLYAEMFALLLETNPDTRNHLTAMIDQRHTLGLPAPKATLPPHDAIRVVPVICIGDGTMSPHALDRLNEVHAALQVAPSPSARLDPLEVWTHNEHGARLTRTLPAV